jgi:hypothetical protein
MDEAYASGQIARRLERVRREAPDAETVRREFAVALNKYREHVLDGWGDETNGAMIKEYWVAKQALALYAQERGISLEVM